MNFACQTHCALRRKSRERAGLSRGGVNELQSVPIQLTVDALSLPGELQVLPVNLQAVNILLTVNNLAGRPKETEGGA